MAAGLGRPLIRLISGLLAMILLLPCAQAASPPPSSSTQEFLRGAVAAMKFGAAASQLALKKTKNDHVLSYAYQVSADYTVGGMKFRQAIADARLPVRDAYDDAHKALFDQLSHSPPGKPFAKAYIEMEAKRLPGDLELFRAYGESGDDERMKLYAQEMVPVLRSHLELLDKVKLK